MLSQDTNLFARVATGYRAPSMQGRLNGLADRPSFADAEKVLSVEAGIKQDLFDSRARLSASRVPVPRQGQAADGRQRRRST